jgi:hypothetical protein
VGTTNGPGFGAIGDLLNTNPRLGPLADNGGPTRTHALLSGSPAINAGDNAYAPPTDQCGLPRIDEQSHRIDIGAFEVRNPLPTITAITLESGPSCRLSCNGMPAAQYALETSSNLVNWTTITNLVAGQNGLFEWRDPNVNDPVRFYRLRQP